MAGEHSESSDAPVAAPLAGAGDAGAGDARARGARAALIALVRHPSAAVLVQFVQFGIVGVSNTLLTLAVYTVLLKVVGVWYLAASAVGFAVGAVNGFLLNRRWTFRGHVGDAFTPVRWGIVQSCGLGVNEGLLYLFVHDANVDKLLAQVCATAVVTVSTFFANRAWTFRVRAPLAADARRY